MPPPPNKPASLWSFISGLLWGAGGGVGFMIWLLFKLLRFQHGEIERRAAWARLKSKQAEGGIRPVPAAMRWEELDPDCRELLRGVDEALISSKLPRLNEDELPVAVGVIWGERDEGGPRWAINQAVDEVLKRRRRRSLSASSVSGGEPGATSSGGGGGLAAS